MARDAEHDRAERAALLLLAYRARSIEEMRRSLDKKGFDQSVTGAVIDELVARRLLDDDGFAYEWARVHAVHRLWSDARIAAGLRERGVSREVIHRAIGRVREEFAEREAVARIVAKKTDTACKHGPHRAATKKRLARNLMGRGFPPSIIYDAVHDMREDESDNGK